MTKQHEDMVSYKVAELLSGMTHGWIIETKQKPFIGNARETDIIAMRNGRETVVIEAKSHGVDIEDGITQLHDKYFGERLKPNFQRVSPTLSTGMAIRYPESVQNVSGAELEKALVHTTDIEYCVIMADGEGNFPKSGAAKGSLRDIANALHIGASPVKKIQEVTEAYGIGMNEWAADIERSIDDLPALGHLRGRAPRSRPGRRRVDGRGCRMVC